MRGPGVTNEKRGGASLRATYICALIKHTSRRDADERRTHEALGRTCAQTCRVREGGSRDRGRRDAHHAAHTVPL